MVARSLGSLVTVALLCSACAREELASPGPLVPEAPPLISTAHPQPMVRSFETKTIGADRYPASRATTSGASTESSPSAAPTPRTDPWSPTPVYGHKNPSPPGPGTPQYGHLNPNPPGPGTPQYGHLNPSPPGPTTPRYGDPNPSPPGH